MDGFIGFITFWFISGLFAGDDADPSENACPAVQIGLTIIIVFCLCAVCVQIN